LGFIGIKYVKIYLHIKERICIPVKNNIREIRKEKGITQLKMAEDLQVTRQTLTAIENNKYNPSLELALKILKYFEVSTEEIFILEWDYE